MIELDYRGDVATLRLNRSGARNALPVAGWAALEAEARALAQSDVRVVVLASGHATIFSAGADIAEFEGFRGEPSACAAFRTAMRDAIEAVAALPMPSIAAIDGGCYGAAVALVLACDFRIAGDGAQFAATPAKLGLGYPREDVARLVAQVGRGQASRMLFSGEIVEADEAHRIGLAELRWEDAASVAQVFADRIAANAPGAIRLLKRTLADPGAPALDAEFDARFATAEFAEGLAAFRARRRPDFA